MAQQHQGIIIKGIGGFYYIKTGDIVVECKARGRFRKDNIKPMVGDQVEYQVGDDNTGMILEILPRRNSIIRPPLANLDQVFIVAAAKDPMPNFLFIDKVAAICQLKDIEPILIINKADLNAADALYQTYQKAGLLTIRFSALNDNVKEILSTHIANKISAFVGVSGVGKSSIINGLDLSITMEVGDISKKIMRGKHTTRHVELIPIQNGYVADTPGFSSFDIEKLENIDKDQLEFGFKEFAPYLNQCRFFGCSHIKEKGCAVTQALQEGEIAQSRYDSYAALYEQIKDKKQWEE